jgi:hypothetical protein
MKIDIPNLRKKTNNIIKIIAGVAIPFLLISCEDFFLSEANNVDIPGSEPQLVVNSFLSPQDSVIKVYLQWSDPYIDNSVGSLPAINTFDVYIANENGNEVKLEYITDVFSLPVSQFPVLPNENYKLRVVGENGFEASSNCFVPGFTANDPEIAPLIQTTDEWGNSFIMIDWQFQAQNTGTEKFYRTGAMIKSYEFFRNDNNQIESEGPYYQDIYLEKGFPLFSDKEGSVYSFRTERWNYFYNFDDPFTGQPINPEELYFWRVDSIFVYLIESDFPYYRYHKSVDDYFNYGDDNPFAESVIIYNNISNGLGTFGGFNKRKYFVATNNPEK